MNTKRHSDKKGQGALEYLLLLAAAVIVVAVVISFMISTVRPVTETGDQQTLDFTCKTLNTNSLMCGCYLCEPSLGGYNSIRGTNEMAHIENCDLLSTAQKSPLIAGSPKCNGRLT